MNTDQSGKIENILVIKLSALGDFMQALGPMAAIRAHHPQAHITLLTTAPYQEFGRACGYFDQVWIDQKPRWYQWTRWRQLQKRLNSGGFSRVYDLQNNDRTGCYFRIMNPRPEWVGAAKGASHRNFQYDRNNMHGFDRHIQTLAQAGITNIVPDDLRWVERPCGNWGLQKPYILIVPGCAPQHAVKRWPAEYYGELAAMMHKQGYQSVIVGSAQDKALAAAISAICPDIIDLTGQTDLFDLVPLARGASGAIGNDTGPMHLIAPTGCPSLVLFSGHTDPARHAPIGPHVKTIQKEMIKDIQPQDVIKRLQEWWRDGTV